MALGSDRYASRADWLLLMVCVLLSVSAMSLPDRVRDPLARVLRQTVLAPLLTLQEQTQLLAASLTRYQAVTVQRDSAVLDWYANERPTLLGRLLVAPEDVPKD